jgi:hypothetical protein
VGYNTAADVYARFARADYLAVDPATGVVINACLANTYFVPREREPALTWITRSNTLQ